MKFKEMLTKVTSLVRQVRVGYRGQVISFMESTTQLWRSMNKQLVTTEHTAYQFLKQTNKIGKIIQNIEMVMCSKHNNTEYWLLLWPWWNSLYSITLTKAESHIKFEKLIWIYRERNIPPFTDFVFSWLN